MWLISSEFLKALEEKEKLKVEKRQKTITKAAEERKKGSKGRRKECNSWPR